MLLTFGYGQKLVKCTRYGDEPVYQKTTSQCVQNGIGNLALPTETTGGFVFWVEASERGFIWEKIKHSELYY